MTTPRRTVLGAGVVGVAAAALAGCSGDDAAGSRAKGPSGVSKPPPPLPDGLPDDLFTIGVASGDPLPDSVMLWTRLVADPLAPSGGLPAKPVPVTWEVATDEGFDAVVAAGSEVAEPRWGHSVHADATGLDPNTWYWYRFSVGAVS